MRSLVLALIVVAVVVFPARVRGQSQVPDDFPRFEVPGYEKEMERLRELYWLHYPSAGPVATLWDEWLPSPSLWPALESGNAMETIRARWKEALTNRIIDPEGYVATHQHPSIAHQLGWPFPFWKQGKGTWGWHFSLQGVMDGWHGTKEKTQEGWTLSNGTDDGIRDFAWNIKLTAPNTSVTTPPLEIEPAQSPFVQLRWRATGLDNGQPYLEWVTNEEPQFSSDKRFYFAPVESGNIVFTMIPVFRHPKWSGEITQLKVCFDNRTAGGTVAIQALFTQYDTRHNINNQCFVRGCAYYFWWTRDINFLRDNIGRMRVALRYAMTELGGLKEKCIITPFVGHCGRSGIQWTADGKKVIIPGRGIGNNYWDLLPMGYKDAYATMRYYDTLNVMARVEHDIAAHPEWDIPGGPLELDPARLKQHAEEVKAVGNNVFWNEKTGRFVAGIDMDNESHDYGFTFLNLEAIYFGFATKEHVGSIMNWICGERIVDGDTAQGADIYHWRFAPRATTKRNIDWYGWFWSGPETIPWGGQVQDGGAVLGFSYHDIMARLAAEGPDNAWGRLKEIAAWFDEVQKAGGYRAYYDGTREGTLQGAGKPGGLGMDMEFLESVLVPQVVLDGFLGFEPTCDGFSINPHLPQDWSELPVNRIHLHNLVLRIRANRDSIEIEKTGAVDEPFFIRVPDGAWQVRYLSSDGQTIAQELVKRRKEDGATEIKWGNAARVRFDRIP